MVGTLRRKLVMADQPFPRGAPQGSSGSRKRVATVQQSIEPGSRDLLFFMWTVRWRFDDLFAPTPDVRPCRPVSQKQTFVHLRGKVMNSAFRPLHSAPTLFPTHLGVLLQDCLRNTVFGEVESRGNLLP